jgi:hypothetical protein
MNVLEITIKKNDLGQFVFADTYNNIISTLMFNDYDLVFLFHKGLGEYRIIRNKSGPDNIWVPREVFEEFSVSFYEEDISEADICRVEKILKSI